MLVDLVLVIELANENPPHLFERGSMLKKREHSNCKRSDENLFLFIPSVQKFFSNLTS